MGPKITVDSSTLMNKGLEVIEAHELFGTDYDRIEVVVHPQSVVHSMVEFTDAATIAQLSMPDMRLPIGYALAFPERIATPFGRIDWTTLRRLEFEPPDRATFRCLDLAYAAGRAGGTAPAWLSAANEVAVDAFLAGRLSWIDIPAVIAAALDVHDRPSVVDDVAVVLDADRRGREAASRVVAGIVGRRGHLVEPAAPTS
jgi:1-deoxy-D-xylulose-5-phosphate reductoisomerase